MRLHNQRLAANTVSQLQTVISHLGRGGGFMSPSTYETAQVLRFCPELVEEDKVVNWLLCNQQPDGGWGDQAAPLYRTVPTLAAVLALHTYRKHARVRQAFAAGQRFFEEQNAVIDPAHGHFLPVAIELILPRLLDEAAQIGISLSRTRFKHLEELGVMRQQQLAHFQPRADSPAVFSWEAWGVEPDAELVGCAGVGHNPAATAWWLHLDRGRPATAARQRARNALMRASRAAKGGAAGIVPDAWPMNRFEQSFVLQLVAIAGLMHWPQLGDVLAPQLQNLSAALQRGGLGFADNFEADGDDSAAAVAALAAAGMPVDYTILAPFTRADRFTAYPHEIHGSFVVTARAVHALRLVGRDPSAWHPYILKAQQADGWWPGDKWNRSRLFGTCLALTAVGGHEVEATRAAVAAFLRYQHSDGGWGCGSRSTLVETAYGLLALHCVASTGDNQDQLRCAIASARSYLRRMGAVQRLASEHMWICKDLYSARRVDQAAVLCALLATSGTPGDSPHSHRRLIHRRRETASAAAR